jgi:hypothetical protein
MDELQVIVNMVKTLPTLAIWVLAGLLFYKVTVVGSIFGILKLLINKVFEWQAKPKQLKLYDRCIDLETYKALETQIQRLGTFNWVYMSDVHKLEAWLDTVDEEAGK